MSWNCDGLGDWLALISPTPFAAARRLFIYFIASSNVSVSTGVASIITISSPTAMSVKLLAYDPGFTPLTISERSLPQGSVSNQTPSSPPSYLSGLSRGLIQHKPAHLGY